jgi:dTDP-glucose 4,6-dehydratase
LKVLLTGASGFAGAHMLKFLLSETDSEVVCPVTYRHGGHKDRIPALVPTESLGRVNIFEHDLALTKLPDNEATRNVDLIINFASESHVDRSIASPIDFSLNNTNLMINLLEFARNKKNLHFVHISTDEVYGSIPEGESNREWERPHLPSNPYSASKSAQESMAIAYFKTYQIPLAIINSTNMIGETQNQEKFLPKVINRIEHGYSINIDTNEQGVIGTRKYVNVWDVANAVWLSALELRKSHELTATSGLPLRYHISGAEEISNLELVKHVGDFLGKEPKIIISPSPRPGYDLRYELSTELIRSLGWSEKKPIREQISEIVRWTISNDKWLFIDYDDPHLA